MHTINHYTLNTGNLRVSYPEEVNKDLFFILKKYINKAKRGKTQLLDGTYMYIIEEEDCYVCTLYGKRGNDFVPIISTSGTKDESARTYVWEQMEHMGQSRVARRLYDASVRNCAIYRGLCSYHISLFLRCINMDRRFCQVLGMDDAFPRGGKRKIMINEDIKALMRKYNVQPHGDQLRLQKILDWDDGEVGKLKEAKPEILQYFKDKEEEKRRQEEETLSKARAGKDGLFLIIDEELGYGIHVGAARWLTEEEKPQYSEWFKEIGMVGAGASTTLDRLTFEDMPRRETDGSLLSSSARVWIISPKSMTGISRSMKSGSGRSKNRKRKKNG